MLFPKLAAATTAALVTLTAPTSYGAPDAGADVTPAKLTCAGKGTAPDAQIRYATERTIEAPASVVYDLLTRVGDWTDWQSAPTTAKRLDRGPLERGSSFRWTTPAPATPLTPATTLVITSSVKQASEDRCVRWMGPAVGEGFKIDRGVHVWRLTPVEGGVRVRTEETWQGDLVESAVDFSTQVLGGGLEIWLDELKATAERRTNS
jgi:hypothetical protein